MKALLHSSRSPAAQAIRTERTEEAVLHTHGKRNRRIHLGATLRPGRRAHD
jgi:hypothetical protein